MFCVYVEYFLRLCKVCAVFIRSMFCVYVSMFCIYLKYVLYYVIMLIIVLVAMLRIMLLVCCIYHKVRVRGVRSTS